MIKMNKLTYKEMVLFALVLLLTLVIRIPNTAHPTGVDTFSNYARAESISNYGYATWVLHPTSLIGMYPLSYPSSEHFFISFFSIITGINVEYSILFTQIAISILGVLGLFIFAREFFNFLIALMSAFIFSISTYFIDFTRWFFTTRILIVIMVPLFLWSLLKIVKEKNHRIKYSILSAIMLVFLAMTHRLVQLVAIVLIAYFLAATIFYFPKFKKTRVYKIYFEKRYKASWNNVIMDTISAVFLLIIYSFIKYKPIVLAVYILFFITLIWPEYRRYSNGNLIKYKSKLQVLFIAIIFGIVLFFAKQMDLLFRGRLPDNLLRVFSGYYNTKFLVLIYKIKNLAIVTVVIIAVFAFFYLLLKKNSKMREKAYLLFDRVCSRVMIKPKFYFSVLVLMVFAILFSSQFLGYSFYTPSEEEFAESLLFKGSSPIITFLNMTINYFTGTTLLLPFVVLGLVFLLFKKEEKSFAEVFLIIILLGFTPLLMDRSYTKAFVMPFFSLFAGIGLYAFFNFIAKLKYKKTVGLAVIIILTSSVIFSNVFINRDYFIKRTIYRENPLHEKNAALFLKDAQTGGAIIVNNVITQVRITAYSGKPDINFLEPIVEKKNSKGSIKPFSFSVIFNKLVHGEKITSFGKISDWIFGGTYYSGEHEYTINRFGYNDPKSKLIIENYDVRYSIWNKFRSSAQKNFHKSVSGIKNKIYDNPTVEIIDIEKGRLQ